MGSSKSSAVGQWSKYVRDTSVVSASNDFPIRHPHIMPRSDSMLSSMHTAQGFLSTVLSLGISSVS